MQLHNIYIEAKLLGSSVESSSRLRFRAMEMSLLNSTSRREVRLAAGSGEPGEALVNLQAIEDLMLK